MARGVRKRPTAKDPNEYVYALEKGHGHIPSRPLFARSIKDFEIKHEELLKKSMRRILAAWS
jgi:hypothetical protein